MAARVFEYASGEPVELNDDVRNVPQGWTGVVEHILIPHSPEAYDWSIEEGGVLIAWHWPDGGVCRVMERPESPGWDDVELMTRAN